MPPPEGTVLPHLVVARSKPYVTHTDTHTHETGKSQNITVPNIVVTFFISFLAILIFVRNQTVVSVFMIYLRIFSVGLTCCDESLHYY